MAAFTISRAKPQLHQCLVLLHRYSLLCQLDVRIRVWTEKWIKQTNKALKSKSKCFCISESEAEPAVGLLFTAVKSDLCGILLCISQRASTCANDVRHMPCTLASPWSWASISPLWAWEILCVISNFFSCQTNEQRDIKPLHKHRRGHSSITS